MPDPGSVFDYNRYMYGYGNPMRLIDPSGHEPIDPDPDFYPCSYTYCEWNNFSMSWEPVPTATGIFGRYLRSPEQLQQDTDDILFLFSLFDPGVIDGTQAVNSFEAGDYVGAAVSAVSVLPFGDIVKVAKLGDRGLNAAIRALSPIHMDAAVEGAVEFAGDAGKMMETPGGNFQFVGEAVDGAGNRTTTIGRLDVNPADSHVAKHGPHLNLEQHVNGDPVLNYHIPIDWSTIRPSDYP